jgi:hypothetical protein
MQLNHQRPPTAIQRDPALDAKRQAHRIQPVFETTAGRYSNKLHTLTAGESAQGLDGRFDGVRQIGPWSCFGLGGWMGGIRHG